MTFTTHIHRRRLLRAGIGFAAAIALMTGAAGSAFAYPDKPIQLVVPYPAGGSVDFIARVLQPQLQEALGQTVIIDNRGGASGMIGSAVVAKAAPDGYTILLGGVQTHAMNAAVIKNMLYDSLKDFTPIIETTRANWILAANPATGIRTPADLVRVAKANPDTLTYASSGNGSAAHLAFSLLASELGLRITHIPYKGIAQGITDALSGEVKLVMGDQSTLLQHVKAGNLIAVAMTGNARSPLLPEVPTIAETIVPGFDVQAWQGIWGPPGMAPELTAKINAAFQKALTNPATVERLTAGGVNPSGGSVDKFTKFTRAEYERWTETARKANITPQ
jgi:tripartite-type tricarboxylate transporter receptor subunit TctC